MTAPTTTPAAEQFLAQVETELADLPAEDRAELLEDLSLHLAAIAEDADERPLSTRLGSPTDYAAELRAAAGLPTRSTGDVRRRANGRMRRLAVATWESRALRETWVLLAQLRPAWWVLRGYLVVAVACLWKIDGSSDFPVPAPADSHLLGVSLVLIAIVASVALGRLQLTRVTTLGVVVANVLALVGAGNLLADYEWRSADNVIVRVASNESELFVDSPLVTKQHGPVTNIFAFGPDGKPLEGVLLFDQDGRPLLSGRQLWFKDGCRRVLSAPRAADGTPVPFSYPKPYVLDPEGKTLSGLPLTPGQCKPLMAPKILPPVLAKQPAPATSTTSR
jgi:hypothetical protein